MGIVHISAGLEVTGGIETDSSVVAAEYNGNGWYYVGEWDLFWSGRWYGLAVLGVQVGSATVSGLITADATTAGVDLVTLPNGVGTLRGGPCCTITCFVQCGTMA